MSNLMFYGVLRMPYEMAMENELSRRQFYDRAQEAANRVEAAERRVEELESRPTSGAASGEATCQFPLCKSQAEQDAIAGEVAAALYGTPAEQSAPPVPRMVTDEMLKAAMKTAIALGMLPKAGFQDTVAENWSRMGEVIKSALAAQSASTAPGQAEPGFVCCEHYVTSTGSGLVCCGKPMSGAAGQADAERESPWRGANAGPVPGDMPLDRFVASLPLPQYPNAALSKEKP